jgi:hypothetical protein
MKNLLNGLKVDVKIVMVVNNCGESETNIQFDGKSTG